MEVATETFGETSRSASSLSNAADEVAAPDVVAVDHAADENLVGRVAHRHAALDQVDGDRVDRGVLENREGIVERAVGRGHEDAERASAAEGAVGGLSRGEHLAARRLDRLADQRGLVELHPLGAGRGEPGEQLAVDRQQVLEAGQRGEALRRALAGLAQEQEGDRADDDRAGREAGGLRLLDLADQAIARELEAGLRSDLGNQVVVVRVEPLRHLERRAVAFAARDREVSGEVDGAALVGEVGEALRNRADRDRGVEHLVVVGERLGDRGVGASEAERREAIARRLAQRGGDRLELGGVDAAGPERLDGALELAPAPDARVAEDRAGGEGGGAHEGCIPSWRMPWCGRWDGGRNPTGRRPREPRAGPHAG